MDPINNPFSPGAGTPPPELVGRDLVREEVRIAIERVRIGNPSQNIVLFGLRGVGKTVLLNQIRLDAMAKGAEALQIEAPERGSLPALLAPQLRLALLKLSRNERVRDLAQRGLRALAGFARALKVTYNDIEVGIDLEPEPGLADNGNLEHDLTALISAAAAAAKAAGSVLLLFIDELQYVPEDQQGALVTTLHSSAQERLPVLLVSAGLPQLRGQLGRAKSYAERMFMFREIGALDRKAAAEALEKPAKDRGVHIEPDALQEILERTKGYPYFLQEWGKHAWDFASSSPIRRSDVIAAGDLAVAALDEGFFGVRLDRVTPKERDYLRAMSELGPGPHRSGAIAEVLKRSVRSLGPVRDNLVVKGMIWSPSHGETAFTVPLFDEFMRRTIPRFDPTGAA